MATTVISAFEDSKIVRKVMDELRAAGLQDRDIEILDGGEAEIVAEAMGRGFGKKDAQDFAKAASRGKTLVAAKAPDEKVDRAVAIMERYEGAQGEERRGAGREQEQEETETVPVVEEELSVGKRKTVSGAVRATSSVTEKPVQKTVHLREEHVETERHRVDRELSPEEADAAFEEKTVEMTETAEEAEVGKVARVVEEVSLTKHVEEHDETVRDKVRRTDVEVERMGARVRKAH